MRVTKEIAAELGIPEERAKEFAEKRVGRLRRWGGLYGFLAGSWKLLVVRGVMLALLGIAVLFWPIPSVSILILWAGAVVFVNGVFALGMAFAPSGKDRRLLLGIEGICGILFGLAVLFKPQIGAAIFYSLIAAWAILTGILQLASAFHLRKTVTNEIWMGVSGACSILFGIVMIAAPKVGLVAVVILIGVYALMFGIMQIALGLRLRDLIKPMKERKEAAEARRPLRA
jgi:uncharacterized membrane protein HdeD (DUF308 family)